MTNVTSISLPHGRRARAVSFGRVELNKILNVYGRMVAAGEWRDYAIDATAESAVFSIYRRASEMPVYRIVKVPALARRQGPYAAVGSAGQVLKRGRSLDAVLNLFERRLIKLVDS